MPDEHRHRHEHSAGTGGLRAKGKRVTRQRELIWQTFAKRPDTHLSAEDVIEVLGAQLPPVNPSTVYRTLDLLVAEGLLLRTDLGADRAYYELALDHAHHHLVCESCGRVAHVHDDVLGDLRARIRSASGYSLSDNEITLYGVCERCRG